MACGCAGPGYGDLGCTGNPCLRTPNADKLYSESVRFTDFHVDPMCAPTRADLMTGKYSARIGVRATIKGRNIMRRDEVTMAQYFKSGGYATAMFGKWHLGDTWPYRPMDRGFDESFCHGGGVIGEAPDYWDNHYFGGTFFHNGVPERVNEAFCTEHRRSGRHLSRWTL
jgi:arylsulfatase B